MDAASFIDLVLTPIGGGVGAAIGTRMVMRKQQRENGSAVSSPWIAPAAGIAVAFLLFATKI